MMLRVDHRAHSILSQEREAGMKPIPAEKRVNDVLLGPLERPALQWLCRHMPSWVTPDLLTTTGVIGSLMTFLGYSLSLFNANLLWLASLGLALNWFGDSLDGSLARHRKMERPRYGFFVDHVTDAVSIFLICLGMGISPYVRYTIASMALSSYLLMVIVVVASYATTGVFKISYGKLGPTELRLMMILMNVFVYFWDSSTMLLPWMRLTIFDLFLAGLSSAMFLIFFYQAARLALQLRQADQEKLKIRSRANAAKPKSRVRMAPLTLKAKTPAVARRFTFRRHLTADQIR